jgi:anti-sigma B factor antagonist
VYARPTPPFAISKHACGGECWCLVVCGEVDMATAPALAAAIHAVEKDEPERLHVDLAAVTFIDVTGLRVLLDAARRAATRGGDFTVNRPQPMVRRLLALAAIDQTLDVADDPPAGLAMAAQEHRPLDAGGLASGA